MRWEASSVAWGEGEVVSHQSQYLGDIYPYWNQHTNTLSQASYRKLCRRVYWEEGGTFGGLESSSFSGKKYSYLVNQNMKMHLLRINQETKHQGT